jgi:hypothetical protein
LKGARLQDAPQALQIKEGFQPVSDIRLSEKVFQHTVRNVKKAGYHGSHTEPKRI